MHVSQVDEVHARVPFAILNPARPGCTKAALCGAAGGMGSSRAQYHLRQVAVFLDLRVLSKPEVFSNAFGESFNAAGDPVDEKLQGQIKQQLQALLAVL